MPGSIEWRCVEAKALGSARADAIEDQTALRRANSGPGKPVAKARPVFLSK
jgi:hypothetical protein